MQATVIQGARIVDGTGRAGFVGDIRIEGDRIEAVIPGGGELRASDKVIQAQGCVVSPGFIDMHSHADWLLPHEDHAGIMGCMLEQGVTTLVAGNCGFSPAPFRPDTRDLVEARASMLTEKPLPYTWRSMAEFLDHVEQARPVLNLAQLVGHGSIRYKAADTLRGPLAPAEKRACLDEVRRAFDEGAWGLSFGLGYDPGMYSPLEELEAFCRTAKENGRPVTVHLKALSRWSPCYPVTYWRPHNLRALEEMLAIARDTGVRMQLSHFIFVGRRSWSTSDACIRMVDDARRDGQDVMIDAFPYTCGNTTVNVVLPYWFLAKIPRAYEQRAARMRVRIEIELGFRLVGFSYSDFQVMDVAVPGWEDLNGLRIDEIGQRWGLRPFDAFLRLSKTSHGNALMLLHAYSGEPGNEGVMESVLAHEACLFETDVILKSTGYPNPAGMGTFPRILGRFVREKALLGLEDAVRRMTLASADRFGIKDRGALLPGRQADLVVFDPETISDSPPEGSRPAGRPKGVLHVFINGEHVVRDGRYTAGVRAGRVLRP